jgi:ADP-ribose pyrophosphatase YjhB (NUDIX family)
MSFEKLSSAVLRQHKGKSFPGISTVFFCHDGAGRIFFTRRSQNTRDEQGKWDIGAGGLKWGQTAEENLRRELKEEYGASASEVEFLGYRDVFRKLADGTPTHWLGLDFLVLVDPSEVRVMEPDMIDDSGWFTLDKLPSPMLKQASIALDNYRDVFQEKVAAKLAAR